MKKGRKKTLFCLDLWKASVYHCFLFRFIFVSIAAMLGSSVRTTRVLDWLHFCHSANTTLLVVVVAAAAERHPSLLRCRRCDVQMSGCLHFLHWIGNKRSICPMRWEDWLAFHNQRNTLVVVAAAAVALEASQGCRCCCWRCSRSHMCP